ncbi:MAG TPA: ABC transporter permease [Thermomicrobiales bacterium]|nr:ABC transporter permease [Thermomicrobiales bacterium]
MAQYILRRLALLIPVLLGVSLVVFTLVRLIPGDATLLAIGVDQRITAEQRELVRKSYGLDQPPPVQYARWMQHVLQGDLGTSLRTRRSVNEELRLRLPVTIELTLLAALLGTVPAMAVGVLAAVRRNSALDYAATIGTLIGVSVPNFLLATLLVLVFSIWLRWLPPIGYVELTKDPLENLRTMLLPALSLSLPLAALLMRNTRSAVLEVLGQEHVRVARAKGLTERRVLGRHVILNASLPILTVVGIQVASLLGGTVIIETIFALPGVGRYIYEAIANRDYPVVQGVTLVIAAIFVVVSMTVDILYAVLDPRLRTR